MHVVSIEQSVGQRVVRLLLVTLLLVESIALIAGRHMTQSDCSCQKERRS